jgi:branched-chain amino acid transport system substrate-binding protein
MENVENEQIKNDNFNINTNSKKNKKIFFLLVILFFFIFISYFLFYYDNSKNEEIFLFDHFENKKKWVEAGLDFSNPFVVGLIMSENNHRQFETMLYAAQDEINRGGGVKGRPLRYLMKDGSCDFERGKQAAIDLVDNYKVDALIGGQCSDEFIASIPISQRAGILNFSPSATSPEISKMGKYFFRTAPSDEQVGNYAALFSFKDLGVKKAIVLNENKFYPKGLTNFFKDKFVEIGGEIIYEDEFDLNYNYLSYVEKIKELNPELLFLVTQKPEASIKIIEEIKKNNIEIKILGSEVLFENKTINNIHSRDILDGVYAIKVIIDTDTKEYEHFFNSINNTILKSQDEISQNNIFVGYAQGVYDIIFLIKEAHELGGDSLESISDYLYNLKNWKGALGTISFNKNGDVLLPLGAYLIKKNEIRLLKN